MKKLDQKDLLLSPKVVTDLTGGGSGGNPRNPTDNCPTNACTENDQCLSEIDNPCASDENCTAGICLLTTKETCACSDLCPETQSDNNICCAASEENLTKCCITPPVSINVCVLTEDYNCKYTDNCQETEGCLV